MENFITKYFSGELLPAQKEELFRQLSENPEAQKEFARIQNSWALAGLSPSDQEDEKAEYYLENFKRKRRKKKIQQISIFISKYAATLLVGVLISYGILNRISPKKQESSYNQLTVPAGQRAQITLSDGTSVWLNSLSTLTYPGAFTGDAREVTLDGEGYFDVTHDEKKAFVVKTQKLDIRVFGTEFNVTAYSDNAFSEVSLLKGSVEVKPAGNHEAYKMKENEKISFRNEKITSQQITPDSKDDKTDAKKEIKNLPTEKLNTQNDKLYISQIKDYEYFKWREGLVCFNNETVENIMEKLQKFYDIQIVVDNPSLLKHRYSGKFRTIDGVEQVIKVLQLEHKFSYTKDKEHNLITIK
jgi:ferric-dicitrate binding protein FerR (iron transport regulator)